MTPRNGARCALTWAATIAYAAFAVWLTYQAWTACIEQGWW